VFIVRHKFASGQHQDVSVDDQPHLGLGNWAVLGKKEASNAFVLSAIRTPCWADILPSWRYQYRCWFTLIVTSNKCPRLPFQRITNFACDGTYRACSTPSIQFALHYMWNWHYTKSGTSRWLWEKPEMVPEKCKLSNTGRKKHSTCLKGADNWQNYSSG
jgi:hypothetical protein